MFIVDEVQTGIGRTGSMFGGMPLSAVLGRAEILDSAKVGRGMRWS